MLLINCEVNISLTWSADCVISATNEATKFPITDTKLYFPVLNLSTSDNAKLLQRSKAGLKRTTNWNKSQSKVKIERQNQYLHYLNGPSFQGVNIPFLLSFENNVVRTGQTGYFLLEVETKDHNIITMDQPVKYSRSTYKNIQKVVTGQGDEYTLGCFLDYRYFQRYYKMIAIALSKQKTLDDVPKAM